MLEGVHHINFLVADLDTAILRYKDLFDIEAMTIESLPERGVRTARFKLSGVWIVLVQPVDEQSEPMRHLRVSTRQRWISPQKAQSIRPQNPVKACKAGASLTWNPMPFLAR
jgi:hypothetical protein